ncbi:MAG: hypothetical protein ACTHZX_09965 [Microbacterium sp.]
MPRSSRSRGMTLYLRAVAGIVAGILAVLLVSLVVRTVMSRFGDVDPHGYTVIFGTIGSLILGLIVVIVLPLALPRMRRGRAYGTGAVAYLVMGLVLVALWFTA